jgi:hypothetical protein
MKENKNKNKSKLYICHPFKGKCKLYDDPEKDCHHMRPHKSKLETCGLECTEDRNFICGGLCKLVDNGGKR